MHILSIVTGPAVEPVSLEQAKEFLRVDTDQDDGIISTLISAARQHAENATGRTLLPTVYDLTLDYLPFSGGFYPYAPCSYGDPLLPLPRPPLQSVQSITYTDQTGSVQTVDPTAYVVRHGTESPGVLFSAYGRVFPLTWTQPLSVSVRYTAGWSGPDQVPEAIRTAILLHVSHIYNHRDAATDVTLTEVPLGLASLLGTYKMESYG